MSARDKAIHSQQTLDPNVRAEAVGQMVDIWLEVADSIPSQYLRSRMLNVLGTLVAHGWTPPTPFTYKEVHERHLALESAARHEANRARHHAEPWPGQAQTDTIRRDSAILRAQKLGATTDEIDEIVYRKDET